jgi:hypothetical protein
VSEEYANGDVVESNPGVLRSNRAGAPMSRTSKTQGLSTLPPCVYYTRHKSFIKIGYSAALHNRIPHVGGVSNLLAVEFGDRATERARHQQFADDLAPDMGREYFHESAALVDHIEGLRADLGLTPTF